MPVITQKLEHEVLSPADLKPGEIYAMYEYGDFEGLIVVPNANEDIVVESRLVIGFTLHGRPVFAAEKLTFRLVEANISYREI